jgi:hypothetical protein
MHIARANRDGSLRGASRVSQHQDARPGGPTPPKYVQKSLFQEFNLGRGRLPLGL